MNFDTRMAGNPRESEGGEHEIREMAREQGF